MNDNENRALHIAMYPWFGVSHITSNLHLANKLAKRGHKISLFIPPNSLSKVASHNYFPSLISFIPIPIPSVDGLPPGAETASDVSGPERALLMTAMDMTRDTIRTHLVQLTPDIVLFDFTYWLPELARELGIKSIYYNTGFLVRLAYLFPKAKNLPPGDDLTFEEVDLLEPPPGFPSEAVRLHAYEARNLAALSKWSFGGLPILERLRRGLEKCDAIGSKTCKEMEGHYADYMEDQLQKSVILAGPVVPEALASTLDHHFDSWLKGFNNQTVIYCALGSECVLAKDQFQEILLGLELTGRPFLAALKPPEGYKTVDPALPEGFKDRTKGKGIVHGGWVQQQLILKHPSIGCFVSHCGAGSISEAMVNKGQLVMIPQGVDQFINSKLLGSELRLGVEVEKREKDGFVTKEAVRDAVALVMERESEVGREVRANHEKLREVLLDPQLQESYITNFIQSLYHLLG